MRVCSPVCVCVCVCVCVLTCVCVCSPVCAYVCLQLQRPEEDILASLWELEEALAEPHPLERPEGHVQNCRNYQESLHYLQAYGTHLALVSFYMRHDGMKEALSHLLSKVRSTQLTSAQRMRSIKVG